MLEVFAREEQNDEQIRRVLRLCLQMSQASIVCGHARAAFRCRSRHQLSYQQAQDVADRRPPPGFSGADIAALQGMLDLLVGVTDAWRALRVEVRAYPS